MASLLRDINREQQKMEVDVQNLTRHYNQLQDNLYSYVRQSVIEWAKLIQSHPLATLLVVETTSITDENGYNLHGYNQNEPIRLTLLPLVNGKVSDLLLRPKHSKTVTGTEYHGLTMEDVADKPTIDEAWDYIVSALANRHVVIFNAEWSRLALQTAVPNHVLDSAFCLHGKCQEYYNQFYHLNLETVLSYQRIDRKREDLKNSTERILLLDLVIENLANGMEKPEPEPAEDNLDDHPF